MIPNYLLTIVVVPLEDLGRAVLHCPVERGEHIASLEERRGPEVNQLHPEPVAGINIFPGGTKEI